MHSTQKLARALRSLLSLVEEEAARNPSFAARLEEVSSSLPTASRKKKSKDIPARPAKEVPNVFEIQREKGEDEFRFWLRSLDLHLLKAIVKANGFDPGKNSQRWSEPDKFADLIAEQTTARLRRGSAFLTPKSKDE